MHDATEGARGGAGEMCEGPKVPHSRSEGRADHDTHSHIHHISAQLQNVEASVLFWSECCMLWLHLLLACTIGAVANLPDASPTTPPQQRTRKSRKPAWGPAVQQLDQSPSK